MIPGNSNNTSRFKIKGNDISAVETVIYIGLSHSNSSMVGWLNFSEHHKNICRRVMHAHTKSLRVCPRRTRGAAQVVQNLCQTSFRMVPQFFLQGKMILKWLKWFKTVILENLWLDTAGSRVPRFGVRNKFLGKHILEIRRKLRDVCLLSKIISVTWMWTAFYKIAYNQRWQCRMKQWSA